MEAYTTPLVTQPAQPELRTEGGKTYDNSDITATNPLPDWGNMHPDDREYPIG